MSKNILDRITPGLRRVSKLEQWRNTECVIDWFKGLPNKKITKFLQIDIVSYYPSITFGLLNKALLFASGRSDLKRGEIDVILRQGNCATR